MVRWLDGGGRGEVLGHCCKVIPRILGQSSEKLRPLENKIRPQLIQCTDILIK
jgi:hypothetical protein